MRVDDPRFQVTGGGLVDMFASVFRTNADDIATYAPFMPATDPDANECARAKTPEAQYRKWRTWQMTDYRPLWIEIEIETDFADQYLKGFTAPTG